MSSRSRVMFSATSRTAAVSTWGSRVVFRMSIGDRRPDGGTGQLVRMGLAGAEPQARRGGRRLRRATWVQADVTEAGS